MRNIDPKFKIDFRCSWQECYTPFGEGYEITEDLEIDLPEPFKALESFDQFTSSKFMITRDKLIVYTGFRWDGSTGAFDTDNAMLASAIHDCFCLASKTQGLDYRRYGDKIFADILKWQGVNSFRAWYHGCAVNAYRWFFCW